VYDDDDLVDEAAVGEKSKRSRKYSETLARRTAQGKARRVKERKRSIAPTLYWGYMRNGEQEVPDPETFVAAQRAWELGLAGNGASETSRILAAEGLPTRSPNRINEMWRSRYYAGYVRYGSEWVQGEHTPIVTDEEFEAMRRQLGDPKQRPGRHAHAYALSRRMKCGYCGKTMGVASRGRGAKGNYECATQGCPQRVIKRADADGAVLAYFENLGLDREATLKAIQAHTAQHAAQAEAVLHGALKARLKLDETNCRLWADRVEGRFDDDDWQAWKTQYKEESAALDAQIAQYEANFSIARAQAHVNEIKEAVVERLTAIRQAAAGIASKSDGAALQAAICRLFKAFILMPDEGQIQADLWLPHTRPKLVPVVHPDALRGVMPGGTPVLAKTTVDLVGSGGEDGDDPAGFTALSA